MNMIDFNRPTNELIEQLKSGAKKIPSWGDIEKDYEPLKHKVITDKNLLKDKVRSDGTIDKSSRISIAIEKIATSRIAEFCFSIPVKRVYNVGEGDETKALAIKAIEAIYKHARIDAENYKRGVRYFASCEVCTIWYAVKAPNNLYGFKSEYKLKCKTYSPMDGYKLYPLFDKSGDMIAMSISYTDKDDKGKDTIYFETFTADKHIVWKQDNNGGWGAITEEPVTVLKIPAAYMYRSKPIFADVVGLREELELTLSRNGNVIAYNAAPILKVVGNLQGSEAKGEGRRIYAVDAGGDVNYVSWNQSIEALKYQVDNLLRFIFMQLQMPDLSFDAMKGLGAIGFDARQTILTDAHLKVGDEQWAIVEFLERECNVIKQFLKMMNVSLSNIIDEIDVEHIITPFIQNDEKAEIERRMLANGGKPIESHLESITRFGMSDSPKDTLKEIEEDAKRRDESRRIVNLFEGAE